MRRRTALWMTTLGLALAAKDKEKKKEPEAFAIVAGTVFRVPGFALPGAEVTIEAEKGADVKLKKTVASDARGEFAVRVPPVPVRYTVNVQHKGFESQSRTVSIEGIQRKEVNFQLEPVSK